MIWNKVDFKIVILCLLFLYLVTLRKFLRKCWVIFLDLEFSRLMWVRMVLMFCGYLLRAGGRRLLLMILCQLHMAIICLVTIETNFGFGWLKRLMQKLSNHMKIFKKVYWVLFSLLWLEHHTNIWILNQSNWLALI